MKKLLIMFGVLAAVLFAVPANAFTIVEKDMGYVSVNSSADKEIIPDTASIYFTVETVSVDSKAAVGKNKELTSNLILSLKPILALDKTDSIQTKNFVLRPNYTYEKNGKKNFVNYTASNTIYVKTKKLENVSKLIDAAVANNATSVSELSFFLENEREFSQQLAQEAISKAKVLAQLTASTLNQKVSGIKSIRVNIYPQNSYNARYSTMNAMAKDSSAGTGKATPVEFGKIKLQANVDAEFYVK